MTLKGLYHHVKLDGVTLNPNRENNTDGHSECRSDIDV